jgi:membrane protease YdiL (CAAX protease family)
MADKDSGGAEDGIQPAAHGEAYPGPPDYPAPPDPNAPQPYPYQQHPQQQYSQQHPQQQDSRPYPPQQHPPQQYPQNGPGQPHPPQDYSPQHPQQAHPPVDYSRQPYSPPYPPQQYRRQNEPGPPYPPQAYPPQQDPPNGPGQPYPPQAYPPQQYPPQNYTGQLHPPAYPPPSWPPRQYPPQQYGPYGPQYPQRRRPWFTGPPPGVPYHRMARTAAMRWWHLIVGTLAIIVAGFVVITGLMLALMLVWYLATGNELPLAGEPSSTDLIFTDDTADLAASLAVIAIFLPIILLAAVVIQHRRPGTLASVLGRLRWRWLLACLAAAIVTCLVSYGLSVAVASTIEDPSGEASWVGWSRFALPALVVVLLVPFQAAAEEFFFRGWLLQGIAAYTLEGRRGQLARRLAPLFGTAWPAIVLSGIVFVLGHGYTGWGMLDVFGFAVVSGWLAVRTGGLESSIAIHVANNLVAFLLSAAAGDLGLEQGSVRWQYLLTDLLPLIGYAAFILWLARRKQVATVTQPSSGSPRSQLSNESGSHPGTPSTAR